MQSPGLHHRSNCVSDELSLGPGSDRPKLDLIDSNPSNDGSQRLHSRARSTAGCTQLFGVRHVRPTSTNRAPISESGIGHK